MNDKQSKQERLLADLAWWACEVRPHDEKLASELVREFILNKWSARTWAAPKGADVGCRYWSESAINHFKAHGKWDAQKRVRALRHEHVIPRAILTPMLLEKKSLTEVSNFLSTHCFGCLLTKHEEGLIPTYLREAMPVGWDDRGDIWARYEIAFRDRGIVIWEVDSGMQKLHSNPALSISPRSSWSDSEIGN